MSAEQNEETLVQKSTEENNEETLAKKANEGKSKMKSREPKSGISDSYIRNLLFIAALVIIGALLTMVFAVLSGVISFDQRQAANIQEFAVARATAYAEDELTAGATSQLALSLIENNQFTEAERVINEALGRDWPDTERNQGIMYAYAVLAHQQGDIDTAIERYIYVMETLRADFERVYNDEGLEPNWARAFGLHPNYFESAVALSFLYRVQGDFAKEVEMLDIALEGFPTAGDIYVFRGNAKLELGDNEGAIADFNEALRFIPGDEYALTGLEMAGGTVND